MILSKEELKKVKELFEISGDDGETFEEYKKGYIAFKNKKDIKIKEKIVVTVEQYNNIEKLLEAGGRNTGMTHWLIPAQMEELKKILKVENGK